MVKKSRPSKRLSMKRREAERQAMQAEAQKPLKPPPKRR